MSKPKYWIIVASKDHVERGIMDGIAQACHGRSAPLKRMNQGDYILFYSSKTEFGKAEKCQKFTAIARVKDDEVYPFQMNESFCPYRRNVEFMPVEDVSILPMISDLHFIKNKSSWGYPFRWGFFEIDQHDFDYIASQMLSN